MKDTFKRTIDEMSDEEFIDFISFLMFSSDEDFEDDDWDFNEMWEDDSEILQDYEDVNSDDDILPF